MTREELVSLLSKVEPALSRKDLVPILTCFCFTGEQVITYDDIVALMYPANIGVVGGVRGRTLYDFLNASTAQEASVTLSGSEATFKIGRSNLKLALTPAKDFVFEIPKMSDAQTIEIDSDFIECFKCSMVSLGVDPAHAWRFGMTLKFTSGRVDIFSTDNFIATHVFSELKTPEGLAGRLVVLPPRFCELFSSMVSKEKPREMQIAKTWVRVTFESGLVLFSRTVESDEAQFDNHVNVFDRAEQESAKFGSTSIPDGFTRILDRALIVLEGQTDKVTEFEVEGSVLRARSSSPAADADEAIKIDEGKHNPVKVKSSPELLKRALEEIDSISFSNQVVVLRGSGFERVVRIWG